jgi:hypothetical protein
MQIVVLKEVLVKIELEYLKEKLCVFGSNRLN